MNKQIEWTKRKIFSFLNKIRFRPDRKEQKIKFKEMKMEKMRMMKKKMIVTQKNMYAGSDKGHLNFKWLFKKLRMVI